jgi:hypothetical protein
MALLLSINTERNMARDLDSIAVPGKRLRMVYEFRDSGEGSQILSRCFG